MDVDAIPIEEMVKSLRRRNVTFVIAYVDHQQLDYSLTDKDITWGIDSGGVLPLKLTLTVMLQDHMEAHMVSFTREEG